MKGTYIPPRERWGIEQGEPEDEAGLKLLEAIQNISPRQFQNPFGGRRRRHSLEDAERVSLCLANERKPVSTDS